MQAARHRREIEAWLEESQAPATLATLWLAKRNPKPKPPPPEVQFDFAESDPTRAEPPPADLVGEAVDRALTGSEQAGPSQARITDIANRAEKRDERALERGFIEARERFFSAVEILRVAPLDDVAEYQRAFAVVDNALRDWRPWVDSLG
jgi:hypothetical protein